MPIKNRVVNALKTTSDFISANSVRALPALRRYIPAWGSSCACYLRQAAGAAVEGLLGYGLNAVAWISFQSLISGLISPLGLAPLAANLTAAALSAVAVWQIRRFLTGLFRLSVKLIRKLFR